MRLLALFLGNRLYYFDRPVDFDTHTFAGMVSQAGKEKTLASQLGDNGYTHCVIGIDHFEAWVIISPPKSKKDRFRMA